MIVRIRGGVAKGLKFSLASANRSHWAGSNETPVQQALAQLLRPGDVFYDIGCNIGFFTIVGARLVGPGGRVVAMEPVPQNASIARSNVARNGFENVQVLELAIGAETKVQNIFVSRHAGGSTLSTVEPPPDVTGTIPVNVATLDHAIDAEKLRAPALIKIDVEGTEIDVLKGMTRTLAKVKPTLIIEVDAPSLEKIEPKMREICGFLTRHEYDYRTLENAYPDIAWAVSHIVAVPRNARAQHDSAKACASR
jgi:FkbM family methyltransferase